MQFLQIVDVIISVLLIVCVLLQQRGSALGDAFGSDSSVYTSRRGAEKVLYYMTIIFGISFVILALLQFIIVKK